jgi:hypothetical protein
MNRLLVFALSLTALGGYAQVVTDSSAVFTTSNKPAIVKSGRKTVVDELVDKKNAVKALIKGEQPAADAATNAEALPDLGLKIQPEKKKRKKLDNPNSFLKNEYDGLAVTRIVNRFGQGDRITTEEFFVLKEYKQPSPYAKDVAWYDERAHRVTTVPIKDKAYAQILHGPYRRVVGDALMEEGYFFVGNKHGRWATYNADFTLRDKIRYDKGFPEDSYVIYYDEARTKVKEIIPKLYGHCTGDYREFYEGGQLKTEGKLDDSVRVGRWREYHQFGSGGRTLREIQYGRDKWDEAEPIVLREWDNRGKLTYENKNPKKAADEEEEEKF